MCTGPAVMIFMMMYMGVRAEREWDRGRWGCCCYDDDDVGGSAGRTGMERTGGYLVDDADDFVLGGVRT